jgi:imidazolonepropionase-like amidohydrolase
MVALLPPAAAVSQSVSSASPPRARPSQLIGADVAFVNVGVLPMDTERVLTGQTVVVGGGKVTAVGPINKIALPAGVVRIDGAGKYLMPGIADMHVHISVFAHDVAQAERRLFRWLADGVTTIRNMDHLDPTDGRDGLRIDGKTVLQLRARAAAGELLSPRIYTAGAWASRRYTRSGIDPDTLRPPRLDSLAAYITAYKAAGYDFIKVRTESSIIFDSVSVIARRMGIPFEGHVPSKGKQLRGIAVENALASGMRSIEHFTGYVDIFQPFQLPDTANIPALAAATARSGVWNCPTLALKEQRSWPYFRALTQGLLDAGAGFLLGTDYPWSTSLETKPVSVAVELQTLVEVGGLTPFQALVAGTRNPAAYFGTLDSSGTVAVGKRADLVLLNGNPLDDIRHVAQPAGVMLGGQWLTRAELDSRLGSD